MNIPYPILVQKLGVIIRSDGVPPYRLKLLERAPGGEIAATAPFGPQRFNVIERDIINPVTIDAGDYRVSFTANDTCLSTTDGVLDLWIVGFH